MMLAYSDIISQCPTQLYYSVLPFLPSDMFLSCQYPGRISLLTGQGKSWSPLLFTLAKDFRRPVVFFAPDGCTIAVAECGLGIQLYEASNGLMNSSIDRMDWSVPLQGMFTADGAQVVVLLASGPRDDGKTEFGIQYCDLATQNVRLHRIHLEGVSEYDHIQLAGDGSYVVFLERRKRSNTRICIHRIHGGDDANSDLIEFHVWVPRTYLAIALPYLD